MSTIKDWSKFCFEVAMSDPSNVYRIRKIAPDIVFKTQLDDSIALANLGYSASGTKLTLLKKYYYNPESLEKAKVALQKIQKKKDYGSVAFSTIGQEKKFTHHQHCIQSISIRHLPSGELQYTVFYRAAEIVKIFTGDMVFLRDFVFPMFGPGKVTFVFSNASFNAMYTPILMMHNKKFWSKGIKEIKKHDPKFYKTMSNWIERFIEGEESNFKSVRRVQRYFLKNTTQKERNEILSAIR